MENELNRRDALRFAGIAAFALSTMTLAGCTVETPGGSAFGPGVSNVDLEEVWDADAPAGEKPDLPRRAAYIKQADNPIEQIWSGAVVAALAETDIDAIVTNADGDVAKVVDQAKTALSRGIASLFIPPVNVAATKAVQQDAISRGVLMFQLGTPATSYITTDQYEVGRQLGLNAAQFITDKLGGVADVLIIDRVDVEVLRPRYEGMKDGVLTAGGGVTVKSQTAATASPADEGARIAGTALQANSKLNVFLTDDPYGEGVLAALRAAGKDPAETYLGGVDGSQLALASILEKSYYKCTVAYDFTAVGFAMGQFTDRWLDGKSVPQVIFANPVVLNAPDRVSEWKDYQASPPTELLAENLKLIGNISYATRDQYLNKDLSL